MADSSNKDYLFIYTDKYLFFLSLILYNFYI